MRARVLVAACVLGFFRFRSFRVLDKCITKAITSNHTQHD